MKTRDDIIKHAVSLEGGYVNDPDDRGGETNHGITIATARANGYNGLMARMSELDAIDIYRRAYWDAVFGDALLALSALVAAEVFDTAVNMGPARAGMFLQRALNVLTGGMPLRVDGLIGPATVAVLRAHLQTRGDIPLVRALNCLQGAFYVEIAERDSTQKRFMYGWLNSRVTI
jgi:lysozyme family protein